MWQEVGYHGNVQGRQHRALRWLIALGALVSLVTGAPALAQDREHVFAWIAPSEPVDAYTIYLGPTSGTYTQQVGFGFLQPDGDGITRSTVILDSALAYYVALTASYQGAESGFSNEVFIAASVCDPAACDDENSCTADDCDATGCTHSVMPNGTACGTPGQTCFAGICQIVDCSDGDVCNGEETLGAGGTCVAGVPLDCGIATQCADPVCDAVAGCAMLARPNGLVCDDGDPSTELDRCQLGLCVGDIVAPGPCAEGDACPQSKEQGACMNVLTKDFAKVARTQRKICGKCIKGQARTGSSAAACIAAYDPKLDKVRARTTEHMLDRCMDTPPDFGPNDASTIYDAAVQAELLTLVDLFGPDLDGALVTVVNVEADKPAARCQAAVFKAAAKCQATWFKQFGKCQTTGLKIGIIAGEATLATCFGPDPKLHIAKACDRLGNKTLPKTCVAFGVDLSDAFPGYATDDASQLASDVKQNIECRVCQALSTTHGLPLDCNTCP